MIRLVIAISFIVLCHTSIEAREILCPENVAEAPVMTTVKDKWTLKYTGSLLHIFMSRFYKSGTAFEAHITCERLGTVGITIGSACRIIEGTGAMKMHSSNEVEFFSCKMPASYNETNDKACKIICD